MSESRNYRLRSTALLAAAFLVAHYVLRFGVAAGIDAGHPARWHQYLPLLEKLSLSLFAITVLILVGKLIERLIDRSSNALGVRYNLVRLTHLVTYTLVAIVAVSFLFQNLYAAAVSFGLISLVLGFALQAPITSFIAWIYIVFRRPYQVGDRIQLGKLRGDVLEIGYLDTMIRECSGDYLGNDRASGRIIHFPNSTILRSEVINYSGPCKPFIWNETAIQIAYTSDLRFVESCLAEAADADFRARHGDSGLDDSAASVYFRVNAYAWLEAVVTYPVVPEDTTGRRNRILQHALPALNEAPERVQFPDGARR
ncbi:MAG TPA: mechanosensitive ion channel [Ottowia sp.]|uniref:mechanosensitive ion channel family protein n=1 Tax=Ottowia sp. TaxID=1898956 RepID=UPI002BB5AA06|nr:mechanosensitive ion channel domain-containing protein [Ottowia sp.]HMN20156.1 mechanosensitive ion channel [Ottowia sp.]